MSEDVRTKVEELTPEADGSADNGEYGADKFQRLKDAEHIRKRPDMYIGDTSSHGLHHLVYELVYNSVDEALAGYCKNIHVKLNLDGSISVIDDGRGIPVDMHPEEGIPVLQMVMTLTGSGAKFSNEAYKTSAGLHGMGAKAVTALSEWVEAEVRRDGKVYQQDFERGKATSDVKEIGVSPNRTGTKVTFKPDPEIFRDTTFKFETLENRLRELAFLNRGLTIKLSKEGEAEEKVFQADGGLREFVAYLNEGSDLVHDIVYLDREFGDIKVEVALQYTLDEKPRIRCYANNAYNPEGGTHDSGFRAGLRATLKNYGVREKVFKEGLTIQGDDYLEGLTAVVNVQLPNPSFESNNKVRLNTPEVEPAVKSVVSESLSQYLEEHPKEALTLVRQIALAAEAREAAAKARKALKERKSILSSNGLPGKLMDCTSRDRDETELFIVEGQSAGGTADSGRDRLRQAILPLRGKVLNVWKARTEKVLSNEEIRNLITAVGVDIENPDDVSQRRYGKIILLTDADVDGQHIRTLLLTFFYRQMQKLIAEGHVYVARPPLYKVTEKKNARFVQTIAEMNGELRRRGLDGTTLHVTPVLDQVSGEQGPTAAYQGERLAALVELLGRVEEPLGILGRRGVNLDEFLKHRWDADRGLPSFHVLLGIEEEWFYTREEVDAYRQGKREELGHDLEVGDDMLSSGRPNGNGKPGEVMYVQEFHEVKRVNEGLARLKEFDIGPTDLVPLPRVAGREPPVRFVLEHGETRKSLPHLRDLPPEVRHLGEKGLSVTRFKGLGEMDDDELWETTLDPEKRTLVRITLEDGTDADKMFVTLMGEKVEPRREFIQQHALEASDVDIHGA